MTQGTTVRLPAPAPSPGPTASAALDPGKGNHRSGSPSPCLSSLPTSVPPLVQEIQGFSLLGRGPSLLPDGKTQAEPPATGFGRFRKFQLPVASPVRHSTRTTPVCSEGAILQQVSHTASLRSFPLTTQVHCWDCPQRGDSKEPRMFLMHWASHTGGLKHRCH